MAAIEPRLRCRIFVLGLLVVLPALLLGEESAAGAPPGVSGPTSRSAPRSALSLVCEKAWGIVPSPSVESRDTQLVAIGVAAPDDIWAVGTHGFVDAQILIEHWDGQEWSIVPGPVLTTTENFLNGVAVVSANDVWAVGTAGRRTLVIHWDGTQWSVVPSPSPGNPPSFTILSSVEAITADDVWAVGGWEDNFVRSTLTLHWDGTQWSVVPSPNAGTGNNSLTDVSAIAANDVWAVGVGQETYLTPPDRTLTMHWDGKKWSIVSSPNVGSGDNGLNAVSAVSSGDVWAVGNHATGENWLPLIKHWDGTQWSIVPNPPPNTTPELRATLLGVTALSANDVWAVGAYYDGCFTGRTVVEHWDGARWTVVPSPNVEPHFNGLNAVAAVSPVDIWAVGTYTTLDPFRSHSLTQHYTDPIMPFSDVCPSDYFGHGVAYLLDHSAISGYADGTFRPYNLATRAQVAKILVLGAGLPITTPPTPTFSDVPATHPFYGYVETAYREFIVSGYADGTFRPNNDVTRGQFAKMLVRTAGWTLLDPSTPTFSDVPRSHTFYTFIETAHCNCAIHGYVDGTFRPANNATRGQIAKAVHRALIAFERCAP